MKMRNVIQCTTLEALVKDETVAEILIVSKTDNYPVSATIYGETFDVSFIQPQEEKNNYIEHVLLNNTGGL